MSINLATLIQATGQSCTKLELQLLEQRVVGTLEWHLLIATLPDWVLFFLHRLQSQQSLDGSNVQSVQSVQNHANSESRNDISGQIMGQNSGQIMSQNSGQFMSQNSGQIMGQLAMHMRQSGQSGQSSVPFDLFFRCMDLCDRLLLDSDVFISSLLFSSSTLLFSPRKSLSPWSLPSAAKSVRCVGIPAGNHG